MNNQHIHCIVNDCHYWKQGNMCDAKEVLVTTDQFGDLNPDNVDCEMAAELTPQQAGSCLATCCKTYVGKGSNKIKADGVKKMS